MSKSCSGKSPYYSQRGLVPRAKKSTCCYKCTCKYEDIYTFIILSLLYSTAINKGIIHEVIYLYLYNFNISPGILLWMEGIVNIRAGAHQTSKHNLWKNKPLEYSQAWTYFINMLNLYTI